MMVGSRSYTLLFSLLLLVSLMGVSEGSLFGIFRYRHVYVRNGLGNGTLLTHHCKSKDDDLGVRTLKYDEEFKFQFKPSFFGNTLFFCSFTWNGKLHWFTIYDYSLDNNYCYDCYWSIKPDHPCRFNSKTFNYDLCPYVYR
ncbi:putative plant self-incompatibility S1 [Lupinus albus]|uniref:S-protein homolog n=1 Tax=Lupinus albus TaxID=3870 RepID=A0A6A4PCK3_LUPAL|nr:putative plant self-incompatibility S1 [Lupinus albus]